MIIRTSDADNVSSTSLFLYPDQFVSYKTKRGSKWIKQNMDYFTTVAYSQYMKSKDTFCHNYNLVKGIIRPEDFYLGKEANNEVRSWSDTLVETVGLPASVRHYPILNPPLNTLVGEQSKRPDEVRVKAFDDDSKNEELQFKTEALQGMIIENATNMIKMKAASQGQQLDAQALQESVSAKVKEYMTDYTSTAEKWANRTIECLKVEFNLKEISEDCFRDLLIADREFFHVFEKNSKTGFDVENVNPKNVWYLTLPDKKYVHKHAYAAGMVHVMELSEILQRFNLSKEEIDELRNGVQELGLLKAQKSNLDIPSAKGWDSIKYDPYSPLIAQQRMIGMSMLEENEDPMGEWLGISSNVNTFGNKYVVTQAYWQSKVKIGKVTFVNEQGQLEDRLVDETYETIPNEVSVEWEYDNRWYRGLNIANRIYQAEPFEFLDYCPIIGVVHEIKNVDEGRSFVDLLKPFQTIYNVCINQLWLLLEKEIGVVYSGSIRDVAVAKDGDRQDALDMWEEEARHKGLMWNDDSPENRKAPTSYNGNQAKAIDLSRYKEMETRYNLAMQMKNEAWELVGITKERTGSIAATQTATGTNAAVSQSYAQTEPYFAQHEYVMNDVCQALLDAAQYIETQKPVSTLNYISTEGEQVFMQINSDELKMRDFKIFATSRSEDKEALTALRGLSQTILQNGGTPYDVTVLYTTNSVRQMRQVYKELRDKMYQIQDQEAQQKQQDLDQQQAQFEYEKQAELDREASDKEFEADQNDLNRMNMVEIALIKAESVEKAAMNATPESGTYEVGEYEKLGLSQLQADREHALKVQKLQQERQANLDNIKLQLKKIQVEREKLQAAITMKKMDRVAQLKAKAKTKK